MEKDSVAVLHVDTEKGWRGGQQQAAYLFTSMHRQGYRTNLICQPHSALARYCQSESLPHLPVKMHGEADLAAAWKIACLCRTAGFRILHLHSAHALALGLWAKLFRRTLILVGVRRVDFHINDHWLSQLKYKNRYLDAVVCISGAVKQVLLEDGVPAEKLFTIRSGIDLRKYETIPQHKGLRKELGVPAQHIVIGTVAAMARHKDYPNLLRAAKVLLDQKKDVTFLAVGDGPERAAILKLADDLDVRGRFLFAGFHEDPRPYLATFDIFVLASKKEGLGTALLEAQAAGVPIVACRTGGIPAVVQHGWNGLLVPPGNPDALATALLRLAESPELRGRLARNSYQTVKRFSVHETIERNTQLYETLVSRASARFLPVQPDPP